MRIAYVFDNRVPSSQADTEQLVNTVSALAAVDGASVRLLVPRAAGPPEAHDARHIAAAYGVEASFSVERYPAPWWPRVAGKVWAGARIATTQVIRDDEVLLTRNLPVAIAGACGGRSVCLDTYRPWPDQVRLLAPFLDRLGRSRAFLGAVLHSEVARASFERCGVPREKLLLAHNGFDPARLEPRLSRADARSVLGLPADRPLVVYTGRIAAEKGLDVLIRIARAETDIEFLLVGGRAGGAFERDAGTLRNVTVAPWCSPLEVAPYLFAADVLVSPPSARPLERGNTVLPMKLFSYLGAGRAILAGRTPDVAGLLVDGENASLARPGDLEDARSRLRRLVDDEAYRRRLEDGALRSARTLTWNDRARRILSFLRQRVASRTGLAPRPRSPSADPLAHPS